MLPVGGATSTDATGVRVTVIADMPLFPSDAAVIATGPPAPFPVTRPFASTVATVASAVCQVTTRPVSGLPFASDRKSTRLNSSPLVISYAVFCLQKKTRLNSSHLVISYAVFCLKKKNLGRDEPLSWLE